MLDQIPMEIDEDMPYPRMQVRRLHCAVTHETGVKERALLQLTGFSWTPTRQK
jgi:hypothetical protein